MIMTIYFDGQFWIAVIEIYEKKRLKVYRHVFGKEPTDIEVLLFVNQQLMQVIDETEQLGIEFQSKIKTKINPKRLQRQVAKEMKQKGISTKAQEAIKKDIEMRKKKSKKLNKEHKEAMAQRKWALKRQKAKQKHKGY